MNKSTSTASTTSNTSSNIVTESSSSNAPLWFLLGHSMSNDRVTIINNTKEKFSCQDCETVKDDKKVYDDCLQKCEK